MNNELRTKRKMNANCCQLVLNKLTTRLTITPWIIYTECYYKGMNLIHRQVPLEPTLVTPFMSSYGASVLKLLLLFYVRVSTELHIALYFSWKFYFNCHCLVKSGGGYFHVCMHVYAKCYGHCIVIWFFSFRTCWWFLLAFVYFLSIYLSVLVCWKT